MDVRVYRRSGERVFLSSVFASGGARAVGNSRAGVPAWLRMGLAVLVLPALLAVPAPGAHAQGNPSFGSSTIADQSWDWNKQITKLDLPQATGGSGALTYGLSPSLPAGLNFSATARTITGKPTGVLGATTFTYTATDEGASTTSLTFKITVKPTGAIQMLSPLTLQEGAVDQEYKFKLLARPTGTAKLAFTSSDTKEVITGVGHLDLGVNYYRDPHVNVTVAKWTDEQKFYLKSFTDADATNEKITITVTGSGGGYDGEIAKFEVTVVDDDTFANRIKVSTNQLTVSEGGASGSFGVWLRQEPANSVTVAISNSDYDENGTPTSAVKVTPTTLTFTKQNYATQQTVTVEAVDDVSPEDDAVTLKLLGQDEGGGPFAGSSRNVLVNVIDDEPSGFDISVNSLRMIEGTTRTFTLEPSTPAKQDGVVAISSIPAGAVTSDFNNWPRYSRAHTKDERVQTVTVTAAHDADTDDETVTLVFEGELGSFHGVRETIPVTIVDDDTVNIVADFDAGTYIDEGSSATLKVRLSSQPSGNVTVSLSSADTTHITLNKSSLSFTTQNWNTDQNVTVGAAQESNSKDDTVAVTLTASGGGFDNVTRQIDVTSNDSTGEFVFTGLSSGRLAVTEGASGKFTVALSTKPHHFPPTDLSGPEGGGPEGGATGLENYWFHRVIVGLSNSDSSKVTVSPASLSFDARNYATPQEVTVSAGTDVDTSNETVTVTLTDTRGAANDYQSTTQRVTIDVTDDNKRVDLSKNAVSLDEGGSDTFTAQLGGRPNGSVTVALSSNNDDVSTDETSLTFTQTNWNQAQTITVSAAQDGDAIDDEAIVLATPSGADFAGVAAAQVAVAVAEDDKDTNPSFGSATIADQTWTRGTAITDLVLPAATGGNGSLTYSISPALPSGVSLNATTRTVSGTPSSAQASATYTWTATDDETDSASLTFSIEVTDSTPPEVTAASVIGDKLSLTFSENMDANAKPGPGQFTLDVSGAGADPTVSSYTLSGTTAVLTLSARVAQGATVSLTYAKPGGANPTVLQDAAGNDLAGFTRSVTNNTDDTAPTVSFKLGDVALTGTVYSNDSDGNIAVTFSEAVYADASQTAFTADSVDDIITLTKTDANGDAIAYSVTVTTTGTNANKVVTISPSSELGDGVVYVAVSNAFYDAQGNQGAATNATFTVDTVAPTLLSAVAVGTTLTATFSEDLDSTKKAAETAFAVDISGENSDPTVSSYSLSGNTATMTLSKAVKQGESLTLSYTQPSGNVAKLADLAGNAMASIPSGSEVSVTNNTDDTAPTVSFKLGDVALTGTVYSNDSDGNIVVTFSEAVYADSSATAFADSSVDDIITLTKTDANGDAIAYSATVTTTGTNANKVVTINPSSDLGDGVVYVAVSNAFYDAQGNQGAATNATFTVDTVVPTVSSASVNGTTLTVNFSEAMTETPLPAATSFKLSVDSGTAPTASTISITGSTATVTLATAVTESQTVELRYVKPNSNPLKDLAGNELATIADTDAAREDVTNNTDDTAPTVTFSPANGTYTNAKSANLTLTFSEAVYKDASQTEFGASDLESLIELKVTDENGTAINFDASINDANTVVTINPSADLSDGDVYVEVGSGFYDADANQGSSVNATFTMDTVVPTVSSASVKGTTLTVNFSESMRTTPLPDATVFVLSVDSGTAPTASTISITGSTATVTLATAVTESQTVELRYVKPNGNPLKDLAGNELATIADTDAARVDVTNNTDTTAPTVTFSPANGAYTNAKSANLTLTFSEAVYKDASQGTFGASDLGSLIELKVTDDNGTAINFDASINDANTVVTVNPSADLSDGDVYVEVGSGFYDGDANQGSSVNATFTVDTAAPTLLSAVAVGTTLTATFSEDLDSTKKAAETAFAVDISGENSDPTVSSYSLSGKTATMTLSKAVKQGESLTLSYTQPSGNAAKLADLAGNAMASIPSGSEVSVTNNTDDTAPTVSFKLGDVALTGTVYSNDSDGNIVVTFSEAVYADSSATAFTDSSVDDIITLTKTDANGDAIAYSATVTTTGTNANKVVTINPSSDLGDGVVYVAVSNAFYDAQGNQGAATNATVTIDTVVPTVGSASVKGTSLTVNFSEAMTETPLPAASSFKLSVDSGTAPTASTISITGSTATVTLATAVTESQTVELRYVKPNSNPLKDLAGNELATIADTDAAREDVTNNTDDTAPTVTFSPANGAYTNAKSSNLTLTFSEAVYKDASQGTFGASDLGSLIELKVTDDNGSAINFNASIDSANTVVTVNPSADLSDGDVYVEVGSGFYDTDANQGSSANATFTVDTAAPTLLSAVAVGTTLTATFSEDLDTSKKAAETAFTVDISGENSDPTVSSYTLSGKTATMTLSDAVDEGDSLTLSYTQPSGNAAKIADLAGNAMASIPSGSEVSVTNNTDDTAPTVSFKLGDVALTGTVYSNDSDGNIVLTFSEAVYADGSATAFTDSSVDDIITLSKTGANGDAISYSATVTTTGTNANKVVTINPSSDLDDGVVYVAVSNAFYDAQGNQGAATNATFTVDTVVPTVSSASVKGTSLTVNFSESMRTTPLPAATSFTLAVDSGTAPTASTISITGSTATVTLNSAVTESQTVTLTYTKPGTNPLKDLAGNDLATILDANKESVTNNTDTTAPTVTFSPANGTYTNAKSANLTLTFSEAVYKDASQGTFGASDLESLVELKVTDDNGTAINFNASIDSANTVVTINPSADLSDGDVYVEVGSGFYDADANQGSSVNATFTVDTVVPTVSSASVNGTTLTVNFSENMKTTPLPAATVFVLSVDSGTAPTASAISITGSTATVTLATAVTESQTVELRYVKPGSGTVLEDLAGNDLATIADTDAARVDVTNNTDDTAPTVTFSPANGAYTNAKSANLTLTFSEAVYKDASQTEFGASDLESLIELKVTDDDGSAISFDASIDSANTVVTINPSADLSDGDVYVEVGSGFYDADANQGSSVNATFTVDTVAPTIIARTPAAFRTTMSLVFSESLDTSKKAAPSAFTLDVAGTDDDPTVSSYTFFNASTVDMVLSKPLKEGETVTLRYTQPSGNAAKLTDLAGNLMATIPSGSELDVNNITDDTGPKVGFKLGDVALTGTVVSNDSDGNIVLTFDEMVYADASRTAFTSDSVDDIITLSKTGANGDAIPYAVTVTSSGSNKNKVVTINPSSDLGDGVVYVAVSNAFYDIHGNQGAATNATFTIDTAAPTVSSASVNGTTLTVNFSENMKTTPLPAATVFVLSVDSGTAPTASAISISGSTATVTLATAVTESQTVELRYVKPNSNPLKDLAGNELATIADTDAARVDVTNNTDDTAPTVTFSPANGAYTNAKSANLTLTFSEAVYKDASQTEFGASDLESLIELKVTDDDGSAISFDASIDSANTVVTINPSADLSDGDVYVEVGSGFYDADANQGSSVNATFTVDTVPPTIIALTPAAFRTTMSIVFSESLDTSKKAAPSAFTLDVAGTDDDPTVSSYTFFGTAAADMVLSKPLKEGETVTLGYTQPSGNAAKLADLAGNLMATIPSGSELDVNNITDDTGPTVSFKLGDVALTGTVVSNDSDGNIVLTFDEAVYADASKTAFTSDSVDDIITLSKTNADGDAIAFAATVTTSGTNANKVVTINPSSNLGDGVVYVAVSNAFYDTHGNQGAATNATFTIDTVVPTVSSASVKGTTLTVNFSESMRTTPLPAATSFKLSVDSGTAPTASTISITGSTATVTLATAVTESQTVELRYVKPNANPLKDLAGNELATIADTDAARVDVTNNTDTTAPTATFSPANGAYTNAKSANLTLTFSEAVYKDASQTEFGASDLESLIELKVTDDNGTAIDFDASIDSANTVVTVNPSADLSDGDVYVEVGSGFYDGDANQGSSVNATFTVDTAAPTLLSAVAVGTTLTATFSEDLDTSKKAALNAFTVDVSGENSDPTVSSYSLSGKTATMTLSKAVKQGESLTLSYTQPSGNAAKLADLAGNAMASIPSGSEVSVTNNTDDTAPTASFKLGDVALTGTVYSNDSDGNIVVTFSEAVYGGQLGDGVHRLLGGRHHHADQDRRQWRRDCLLGDGDHDGHERQQGRHDQPVKRSRRRRGLRGRLQRVLRRPGQPGRGDERDVHGGHGGPDRLLGLGQRHVPDGELQREHADHTATRRDLVHAGRGQRHGPDRIHDLDHRLDGNSDIELGGDREPDGDADLHQAELESAQGSRRQRARDDPRREQGVGDEQHRLHGANCVVQTRRCSPERHGGKHRLRWQHRCDVQRSGVCEQHGHGVQRLLG